MDISQLTKWAKEIKQESREKRIRYNQKYLPKIDAYVDMIIARGDVLTANAIKGQRYMEEIQDALVKLTSYGVNVPSDNKRAPIQENPLKP